MKTEGERDGCRDIKMFLLFIFLYNLKITITFNLLKKQACSRSYILLH